MLKCLIFLYATFYINVAIAQQSTDADKIDSVVAAIDSSKNLQQVTVDGTVTKKSKSFFKRKSSGSFSEDYYYDRNSKRLLKVSYQRHLGTFLYEDFYFLNDSLIFVATKTGTAANSLYYFKQDMILKTRGSNIKADPQYFVKKAMSYLKDFKELSDSRAFRLKSTTSPPH